MIDDAAAREVHFARTKDLVLQFITLFEQKAARIFHQYLFYKVTIIKLLHGVKENRIK